MNYIEDYLKHYVEVTGVAVPSDQIFESIHRQCEKNVPLTDRQYILVKNKLLEQYHPEDFPFTGNEPLRMPLREIDRSKYVHIVDTGIVYKDTVYESYKEPWQWIMVRFPFSKKDIVKIEHIAHNVKNNHYYHKKGSHEHFFKLNAKNLNLVVTNFSNFEFDDQVKDYKIEVENILQDKDFYINKSIISPNIKDLTKDQIIDRRLRFGLIDYDLIDNDDLKSKIVYRKQTELILKPSVFNLNDVVETLYMLDRFPIICLIDDKNEYEQVSTFYNSIGYLIPAENQSVLFRVENDNEYNVNHFIHEKKLNNWVDNLTKIVYIKKNKLPKLLVKDNFKPMTAFAFTAIRSHTIVSAFIDFNCDLKLYYDEVGFLNGRYKF